MDQRQIAVIGLGYVGLPLAVEFGKNRLTLGFDLDQSRIDELAVGEDRTREVGRFELEKATQLSFTTELEDLSQAGVFIVTVPTPLDNAKNPDLSPLISASQSVGSVMQPGSIVIYESTVFPGATEEICVPLLEETSGLKFNEDFFVGYSPERINPGDKQHKVTTIKKVTSGSTGEAAEIIDSLYREIITAGTYKASSIRVAEAAKVIENTQRDVNIALINELAVLFNTLGINTHEVLEAAGTKWNFLPFKPGLVGGHCIGVDPYYLTYKAREVGHHPEIILAGRKINDEMGRYVADQLVLQLAKRKVNIPQARVLVLGFAFKENCPDVRNTRVVDVVERLKEYGIEGIAVADPEIDSDQALTEYGITITPLGKVLESEFEAVLLAVAHDGFLSLGDSVREKSPQAVIYDLKNVWRESVVDMRL